MTTQPPGHLEPIATSECLGLLLTQSFGRICLMHEGIPTAFPVNYRVGTDSSGGLLVVIATRADSLIHRASGVVSFEIDGIDESLCSGWSVIAVGPLFHAHTVEIEVRSWLAQPGWTFAVVHAERVSGRRLAHGVVEWPFHVAGYS